MTTTSASEKISQGTLNLTMPGYMVEPLSGQLIGGNDLSAINAQRLNLHGLTKTWQFSVWDLWGMVRALWYHQEIGETLARPDRFDNTKSG